MRRWISVRLRRKPPARAPDDERLLALEREAQALRLELEARERAVASLKNDLERHRSGESARIAQAVQGRMEKLLADAAGPVAQFLTQAHLLEVEGKPVQARDMLPVTRRLIRILQDEGLTLQGEVGERASFDLTLHEPLSGHASFRAGEPVVVRFVGVGYAGKTLRKAGVEAPKD